jgi:hypothetical protein
MNSYGAALILGYILGAFVGGVSAFIATSEHYRKRMKLEHWRRWENIK